MSEVTKAPTHFRLISNLKSIGPYLLEPLSRENYYLFDCLSVCVNDQKSPEEREFWGWWLELERDGDAFCARYLIGLYDIEGNWQEKKLPKKAIEEVNRTQMAFHEKLEQMLSSKFALSVKLHPQSAQFT